MTVQSSCWIGIDTGGTFTDVVLADRRSGSYRFRKVPSNPTILRGLDEILAEAGIGGERVEFVGLGTTLQNVNFPLPQSICRCVKAICYAF